MQKDTNNQEVTQKDNTLYETISLVFKDSKGIFLYKKSEKISKAFFMLTQHLEDSQSIKARLRDSALELLDKSYVFLSVSKLSEDTSKEVVLNLMKLISLSDIGLSAKFISDANYQIIIKQIHIFIHEISEHLKSVHKDGNLIPSTLFDISFVEEIPSVSFEQKTEIITSPNKDNQTKGQIPQHKVIASVVAKDNVNQVDEKKEKNTRQDLIINTIRQRGELSIKDLTDVIKGCSEKTIQRELVSLVSSGTLLKTGERRWSRYSLSD